jgi:citrate synthase
MPAPAPHSAYLNSREASARLGVKAATLYAYASRGLVQVVAGRGPKASLYLSADVERLRDRSRARLAQGPIAGAALNFGEPVLETALVRLARDTLYYRGADVLTLSRERVPFENVAELLWTGARIEAPVRWRVTDRRLLATLLDSRRAGDAPLARLRRAVGEASCAPGDPAAHAPEEELAAMRQLILILARLIGPKPPAARSAREGVPLAEALGRGLGIPQAHHGLLNSVLVLVAEHELNASSFVARVASSTRASLYACLEAALATHSGPRHGGYSLLIERQLGRLASAAAARAWVRETLARGKHLLGFGMALYPDGDPRARELLAEARGLWRKHPELERAMAIEEEALRLARLKPNLDFALAALGRLWKLPPGTLAAVFALGRCAGWAAHVLEQRNSPALIRPRAKYVGP